MIALRAEGNALKAIAAVAQAKGHKISPEGVAGVLRVAGIAQRSVYRRQLKGANFSAATYGGGAHVALEVRTRLRTH